VSQIKADPYDWPYDGNFALDETALICIDWQRDFCGKGGYVDQMGYDLSNTRRGVKPTQKLLERWRDLGGFVVHAREGHRPDMLDCPENKHWRSKRINAEIGSEGPLGKILIRGEEGWQIVPELAPEEGEPVIDKPGKGAFYSTDLDLILRNEGISKLILTGITTDVCVHTTLRGANDRGYECLLLEDCSGATDHENHEAAIEMTKMQGGLFGSISDSENVLEALEAKGSREPAAV